MTERLIEVAFPLSVRHQFTYRVPPELRERVVPGMRVLAPLGQRQKIGFVVGEATHRPKLIKEITDLLDPEPIVVPDLLRLTRWMADYYFSSWGECLQAVLPAGIQGQVAETIRWNPEVKAESILAGNHWSAAEKNFLTLLSQEHSLKISVLKRTFGTRELYARLIDFERRGFLVLETSIQRHQSEPLTHQYVRLTIGLAKEQQTTFAQYLAALPEKQKKKRGTLQFLADQAKPVASQLLVERFGVGRAQLRRWVEEGLVELFDQEEFRDPLTEITATTPLPLPLTPEQRQACGAITQAMELRKFQPFLLWGVTGSGKTQVYLEAIRETLKRDKSAIVLVPEISLSSQLAQRFKAAFGGQLAFLHSGLSAGERADSWRKIKTGEKKVVVGVRSAIFAPVADLGLVVVDEEHADTYKQADPAPRYHARDVAVMRAKENDAVAILGSATPSLESFYNAQKGKYHLLELPVRVLARPLPNVEIIDLKQNPPGGTFSGPLVLAVKKCLTENQQVLLFLNRRGFAGLLKCGDCGFSFHCPNCSTSLTYHRINQTLRCHFCDRCEKPPDTCPCCRSKKFLYLAHGTQRVEAELKNLFPGTRFERMDTDTTRGKLASFHLLDRFARREFDLLLGTQMIAKGLDFPDVGLVGVVSADLSLHLPDFRAKEKTFQLLTQVAGRTGRGDRPGQVLIQTYAPDEPVIQQAARHDYRSFYQKEIGERLALSYPPFSRLIALIFRSKQEKSAEQVAGLFALKIKREVTRQKMAQIQILGPAPAPFYKLRKEYRWRVTLKAKRVVDILPSIAKILESEPAFRPRPLLRITVDVDPQDLL